MSPAANKTNTQETIYTMFALSQKESVHQDMFGATIHQVSIMQIVFWR